MRCSPSLCASVVLAGMTAAPAFAVQPIKHVMIVVFENEDDEVVMEQPFFAKIASEGVTLKSMYAETHPSQGNYFAMATGDTYGVNHDDNIDLDVQHIGDLLEAKGKSWKVYAEGFPGNCAQDGRSGDYVRKHTPFVSFVNLQNDQARCNSHLFEAVELWNDVARGTLPDFAFYVPTLKNDGHDTGVGYANDWYERTFGPLMAKPAFTDGMLLISTFDEDSSHNDNGNHIYTTFWGPTVKAGAEISDSTNHYGVLRTIEEVYGLGNLGHHDAEAAPLTGWRAD